MYPVGANRGVRFGSSSPIWSGTPPSFAQFQPTPPDNSPNGSVETSPKRTNTRGGGGGGRTQQIHRNSKLTPYLTAPVPHRQLFADPPATAHAPQEMMSHAWSAQPPMYPTHQLHTHSSSPPSSQAVWHSSIQPFSSDSFDSDSDDEVVILRTGRQPHPRGSSAHPTRNHQPDQQTHASYAHAQAAPMLTPDQQAQFMQQVYRQQMILVRQAAATANQHPPPAAHPSHHHPPSSHHRSPLHPLSFNADYDCSPPISSSPSPHSSARCHRPPRQQSAHSNQPTQKRQDHHHQHKPQTRITQGQPPPQSQPHPATRLNRPQSSPLQAPNQSRAHQSAQRANDTTGHSNLTRSIHVNRAQTNGYPTTAYAGARFVHASHPDAAASSPVDDLLSDDSDGDPAVFPSPATDSWSVADDAFVHGLAASCMNSHAAPRIGVHQSQQSIATSAFGSSARSRPSSSTVSNPIRFVPSTGMHRRASDVGTKIGSNATSNNAATMPTPAPDVKPNRGTPKAAQRPRTTHGIRDTQHITNNTSAPAASAAAGYRVRRIGSAGIDRYSCTAAAREEAAAHMLFMAGSSQPPISLHPASSPPLSPPSCTLTLAGSSFYDRLPDELWIEVMTFIDSNTLLNTVARIDTTSRQMVRNQEIWRCVVVADTKLSPASSNRSMNPVDLATRATPNTALSHLVALADRWTLVERLDLTAVGANMRDEFFAQIEHHPMPYWPMTLRELSLARCAALTDASMSILGRCIRLVTKLDLSWCTLVTDVGFASLLRSCGVHLETCILNRCNRLTDDAIGILSTHAHRLKHLDLTFCMNITDEGLKRLANKESTCFYPNIDNDNDDNDAAVRTHSSVASNHLYGGLESLSLRWCQKITDRGIELLLGGGVEPKPDINESEAAAGESHAQPSNDGAIFPLMMPAPTSIAPVALRSNALRRLNLDHCSLLTDRAIMTISKAARQLRELSTVYCKMLTPVSFQYLVSGCTIHLRRLIFDHCDLFQSYFTVTNVTILRSLLSSPTCRHLSLLSCRSCPHAGIERARHKEIEAECCENKHIDDRPREGYGAAAGGGVIGLNPRRSPYLSQSHPADGNVLSWIHKLPAHNPNTNTRLATWKMRPAT